VLVLSSRRFVSLILDVFSMWHTAELPYQQYIFFFPWCLGTVGVEYISICVCNM